MMLKICCSSVKRKQNYATRPPSETLARNSQYSHLIGRDIMTSNARTWLVKSYAMEILTPDWLLRIAIQISEKIRICRKTE